MSDFKTAGVVAEFNPFHNGHAFLIKTIRDLGFSHVVVVMSGNYTQRGEAAIMHKSARARAAIYGGADLVVELPTPFALSSAEKFAYGAVNILDAIGCVDTLCFGSECGSTEKLAECAERIKALDSAGTLAKELKSGVSFPKARAMAIENGAEILSCPNDTLAVEYIKALDALKSDMRPLAIKRVGARHDGDPVKYGDTVIASASAIRRMINSDNPAAVSAFMPRRSFLSLVEEIVNLRAPFQNMLAEPLILAKLRRMNADDFKIIPDVTEGLENRIFKAARQACSLAELYAGIKSKRYTLSRIRRIILRAYLEIDKSYTAISPPYIRVLAFNRRGQELLRLAKEKAKRPLVTRYADILKLGVDARRLFNLECQATDLYFISTPKINPCGFEQKLSAVKLNG